MPANDDPVNSSAGDFQRLKRALRTLSATNHALLRASDEKTLLNEICRVAVEEAGYIMACVAYKAHDAAKSLPLVAYAGFETGFWDQAAPSWDADSARGRGVAGTAILTGKPAIIRNVLADPNFAPFRELAIERGYRSVIGLPLKVEGDLIGVLCIYAPEPDAFDGDEVSLLGQTAEDLAYGIESLRLRLRNKEAEETIKRLAYFDSLTGLPNRTQLRERLEQGIAEMKQQRRPLALLHVRVSRFREINETLGHLEGDKFLQETASRLAKAAGETGTVARTGEDEFAILLPKGDAEFATRMARKILVTLYEPVELSGLMLDSRAAIGIALFPGHGTDPTALMRRASVALYQAEHSGSGIAVYTGTLDAENAGRLALMGDLRRAIERNELLLYCQPKVHISSRRVCGAEALVRWQHPQHGLLNPAAFIKLAENTGQITPLTYWILDAALGQSYAWREAGLAQPLAINLSAHDLRDPRLLDRIGSSFATWGAQPDWIQFELTESTLMEDPVGALVTLARLKDLGVKLFIDDFGTGYSSLAYLQKLPVDSIKIDQSFVGKMTAKEDSAVIVRSTIELAHNLGLEVVAEGVENEETWTRLATLGCDVAQGYCISMPIPAEDFKDWEDRSRWHARTR